ncbi:hypothetical protein CesoFtcFv8_025683 [Champsocephalus esox]|uniref:Uncharacterized protein n=1 Tax=Champsocephalus esox TaxID=159716 RepID=A0AAN8B1C7_9TELE|nr:hypothetical protein CesoFtcFv8_025683 [Champsocephalus esox]
MVQWSAALHPQTQPAISIREPPSAPLHSLSNSPAIPLALPSGATGAMEGPLQSALSMCAKRGWMFLSQWLHHAPLTCTH